MDTPQQTPVPILETAWTRFAQMDEASLKRSRAHLRTRYWIALLGIVATLLAILSQIISVERAKISVDSPAVGSWALLALAVKIFLILTPIIASILAAFASKTFLGGDWLVKRAGAEEILKEIYMFRTVLQKSASRRAWLERRLADIQRDVYSRLGGELTMPPYKGKLPPYYNPEDPTSDPGFSDLSGEEYFRYRLVPQIQWHTKEVNEYQVERTRLQWLILLAGGAGAFLAAFDQTAMWVALTAAFTAAFLGWQELRNIDAIIRNYSRVIMELNIIYDHWYNLELEERVPSEFFKMVRSAEKIMWSQNEEYIKSMQEALKEADLEEEASLVNRVIKESVEADARLKQSMSDSVVEFTTESLARSESAAAEEFEEALNSLAEEASSEIVRAELASMGQAVGKAAQELVGRASSGLKSSLKAVAEEFDGVEVGKDTPMPVVNDMMSRYPKTNDVKG